MRSALGTDLPQTPGPHKEPGRERRGAAPSTEVSSQDEHLHTRVRRRVHGQQSPAAAPILGASGGSLAGIWELSCSRPSLSWTNSGDVAIWGRWDSPGSSGGRPGRGAAGPEHGHGRHREQHLQAVAEPHDLTLPSSCTPARSSLQGAPEAGSRRSEVTGLDGMTDWVSAKGAHARPFLSTRMWPQPLPPPKAPQTNIARSAPDGTVPLTRSSGEKIRAPRVTNMPGTSLEPTRASRLQSGRLCPHGAYLGVGSQQRSGGGGWRHRLALWLDQSQLPPWGQSCLWVLVWRLQPNPAAAHLRGAREAGSPGPLPASRSPHAKALGTLPRAVRPTGRPHPGWMPSSPRAVATRKLDSQPLPSSLLGPQLRRSTHPRRTA